MDTPTEKSSMMFASMVMMFSTQAMMAMGKVHNPMTGTIQRDLNAAQYMIDLLVMVEERTKGNLSEAENNMLATTLRDLRLNYVVEKNKEANPASPAADTATQPEMIDGAPENVA
jgi:Na+-translocating ferredoxin:NAD+ oxidoreductase RnfG subunit